MTKDYFAGITDDVKPSAYRFLTWVGALCLVTLLAIAATYSTGSNAAALYVADVEGVKISLTDEPCKLTMAVENLKYRATWTEKGKTFEGCYGGHPFLPIVMAYFSDKTVVALPVEIFGKPV